MKHLLTDWLLVFALIYNIGLWAIILILLYIVSISGYMLYNDNDDNNNNSSSNDDEYENTKFQNN